MSTADPTPAAFGSTLSPDTTHFRCWSPGARHVELLLDPDTPYQRVMQLPAAGEGFFELRVAGIGGGQRYRIRRDERWPQPDPASHFQPDGVFGPSEVIDFDYPWQSQNYTPPPPEDLVLYELHVGTFSAAGNYAGVAEQLDHLARLGITAIKLMPLATFAGRRNWGYDGVFHFAPFAPYGRPRQLQRLVDACHLRGIAVLLDVVTNHFGPEGNPMWDFARPFFARNSNTAWGPGPDFGKEAVCEYFRAMARHYRRHYRIDGLRVDAVHAIPPASRQQHLEGMAAGLAAVDLPGPSWLMLESIENAHSSLGPKPDGVHWMQLNFDYQHSLHAELTGERHAAYRDAAEAPQREVAAVLSEGFSFFERTSKAHRRKIGEAKAALSWQTLVNFLVNHDTSGNRYLGQRLQQLIDAERFVAATTLLLLHPAIPYLFAGQEWASASPFFFFTDFSESLGRRIGKDRLHGFAELKAGDNPQHMPLPQDAAAFERSKLPWGELELPEHLRFLDLCRELLALRRRIRPLMSDSSADCQVAEPADRVYRLLIAAKDDSAPFVLVANLSDMPAAAPEGSLLWGNPEAPDGVVPPRSTMLYRQDKSELARSTSR